MKIVIFLGIGAIFTVTAVTFIQIFKFFIHLIIILIACVQFLFLGKNKITDTQKKQKKQRQKIKKILKFNEENKIKLEVID